MINKDHGVTEADNPSLFFMVAHGFIHIGYYYRPQSTHWNIHNSSTAINFSLRGHSNGPTFLRERNLSRDGVNGEHLAGWNPGRLFQEAEAQLAVDWAAIVPIQSLHLHKRDPWDTGRGHKVDNQHQESKSHVAEVGGCDSSAYETFLYFYHHTSSSAQGSLTFEKPELNAASHALANKSGHIVILVNDAHFYREALTARRRPERHLRSHTLLPWWWTSVGMIVKDEEATVPAVSMTAVSLCPEVSEHTETERPLRICPHRPPSPPAQCDWGAGYKAAAAKEKFLVMTLCCCLQSGQICTAIREGRRSESTGHSCVFMLPLNPKLYWNMVGIF